MRFNSGNARVAAARTSSHDYNRFNQKDEMSDESEASDLAEGGQNEKFCVQGRISEHGSETEN